MAIVPKHATSDPHEGEVVEYAHDHPTERPEDWGWHAEWGKVARIGGWVSVVIIVLMATATHYNHAGQVALYAFAALLAISLVWDVHRRRTSWRK